MGNPNTPKQIPGISTEVPPQELIEMRADTDDQKVIDDILSDYRIDAKEFPMLRITNRRIQNKAIDERIDVVQAIIKDAPKGSAKAKDAEAELASLEMRRIVYAEQIAQERMLMETVSLYGRFRLKYEEARDSMKSKGFTSLPGAETREKLVDDQLQRIGALFIQRAELATINDRYVSQGTRPSSSAEKRLNESIIEHFEKYKSEYLEKYKLASIVDVNGKIDLAKAMDIVQKERLSVEDRILAELHFTSPELVEAEHLYRRLAWAINGHQEALPDVDTAMKEFIEKMEKKRAGVVEIEQVLSDMKALRQKKDLAPKDIVDAFKKMPKKQPEPALLLADTLSSWLEQLAERPTTTKEEATQNKEARAEAIERSHQAVADILELQQAFIREFSGQEHLRTWYSKSVLAPTLGTEQLTEGLNESHRAELDVRLEEVYRALTEYDKKFAASWSDRARDTASSFVVEPARGLMSKIEALYGSDTQKTKTGKGLVEIMNSYDRKPLENLQADVLLFRAFSKHPRMKPEGIRKELEDLPPQEVAKIQTLAADMTKTGMTPDLAMRRIGEGNAMERMALWLWLHGKFNTDLSRFKMAQANLLKALKAKGDEGDDKEKDLTDFINEIRDYIALCVAILAAIILAPYVAEYLIAARRQSELLQKMEDSKTEFLNEIKALKTELKTASDASAAEIKQQITALESKYDAQHAQQMEILQKIVAQGGQPAGTTGPEKTTKADVEFGKPGQRTTDAASEAMYMEKWGWKLHLTVKPENLVAVDKWLFEHHKGVYKLGMGGGNAEGSDFTIYIGSGEAAKKFANEMESQIGNLIELSNDPNVDKRFTSSGKVTGRFTTKEVSEYGADGVPFDEETRADMSKWRMRLGKFGEGGRWRPHNEAAQKQYDEIRESHRARIDAQMRTKYGEYYTAASEAAQSNAESELTIDPAFGDPEAAKGAKFPSASALQAPGNLNAAGTAQAQANANIAARGEATKTAEQLKAESQAKGKAK